jgi:chromosome segregation ATPase
MICLKHVEWSMFPTAKIAEMCDVSIPFVAKLRRGEEPEKIKYVDKDGEIIERKNPSKKNKEEKDKPKEEKLLKEEPTVGAHELEQANEAIDSLSKANQDLEDKLAVQLSPDPAWAENYIAELREQINLLEIELDGVKKSRNSYQTENAELMKQVRYLEKKVKKLEAK